MRTRHAKTLEMLFVCVLASGVLLVPRRAMASISITSPPPTLQQVTTKGASTADSVMFGYGGTATSAVNIYGNGAASMYPALTVSSYSAYPVATFKTLATGSTILAARDSNDAVMLALNAAGHLSLGAIPTAPNTFQFYLKKIDQNAESGTHLEYLNIDYLIENTYDCGAGNKCAGNWVGYYYNRTHPTAGDELLNFASYGNNSAGRLVGFAYMDANALAITDGSERGGLEFGVHTSESWNAPFINMDGASNSVKVRTTLAMEDPTSYTDVPSTSTVGLTASGGVFITLVNSGSATLRRGALVDLTGKDMSFASGSASSTTTIGVVSGDQDGNWYCAGNTKCRIIISGVADVLADSASMTDCHPAYHMLTSNNTGLGYPDSTIAANSIGRILEYKTLSPYPTAPITCRVLLK